MSFSVFTLFLLSLINDVGDMVFYTTTPWLYPLYEPIVFQRNYNYLREMETIVAHDHLFQFSAWRDDLVYVSETTNPRARQLALYEVQVFRDTVIKQMDKIL